MEGVRTLDVWRSGMLFEGSQGEKCEVALEGRQISLSCVSRGTHKLIKAASEQLEGLLDAVFAKSSNRPFQVSICCPHCMVRELDYEHCIGLVVSNKKSFACGQDQVPVSLLGSDLNLSFVVNFKEDDLVIEPEAFASGGFGKIFKGYLSDSNVEVAIKELKAEKIVEGFPELQHEVGLMSQLNHPNLIRLFGVLFNPLRLVMEFCTSGDLYNALRQGLLGPCQIDSLWLKKPRIPPKPIVFKILSDIAKGMEYLHGQNPPIAHRDLRSPNVLLCTLDPHEHDVCAKVADFGLSVAVTDRLHLSLSTWEWMAPEAQRGEGYSEQCDLYSFGIVAFEICRGQSKETPFGEYFGQMREAEIHHKIMTGLRPSIPSNVPAWLKELIERLWVYDPRQRPSFEECVKVLNSRELPKERLGSRSRSSSISKEEQCRLVFRTVGTNVNCIVEHPLEREVWCGFSSDGLVCCYDANTLKKLHSEKLSNHHASISCITMLGSSMLVGCKGSIYELKRRKKKLSCKKIFKRRSEVLGIERVAVDLFLVVYKSGQLVTLSDEKVVGQMALSDPISCYSVQSMHSLWLGCGTDILKIDLEGGKFVGSVKIVARAADMNQITHMCCSGMNLITLGKDLKVWKGGTLIKKIEGKFYCLSLVIIAGKTTICMGSDGEVFLYDEATLELRKRVSISASASLSLSSGVTLGATKDTNAGLMGSQDRISIVSPRMFSRSEGDLSVHMEKARVVCTTGVGYDSIWVSVLHQNEVLVYCVEFY